MDKEKEEELQATMKFMASNQSFAGEFFDFLKSLETKYKCVFCGSDSLTTAIYFSQGSEYLPSFVKIRIKNNSIAETSENFGMPLLHMSCDRCGHLSLFDAEVYLKWKKQKNDKL